MKILLILLLFTSCMMLREELQVKGTYVTVIEITKQEKYGHPEELVIHLQSDNGIRYIMVRPMQDSNYYIVNRKYPFLSPR
jgi:hypothetical protein